MGLVDNVVDRALAGSILGNRFHSPEAFAIIIVIIHNGIIALLEFIGIGFQIFLPLSRIGDFQDILCFAAIVVDDGLRPEPR